MMVDYAADMVVLAQAEGVWHVLVIQREREPYAGMWALPGGHVEACETAAQAATRELWEETGVQVAHRVKLVGVYDAPGRDPRGPVVSAAFLVVLDHLPVPASADDARDACWTPLTDVISDELAFDHTQILHDAVTQAGIAVAAQRGRRADRLNAQAG